MAKYLTSIILLALVVTVALFTYQGESGFTELKRMDQEVSALRREAESMRAEVKRLETLIARSASDRGFLERRAREELALAHEGEIVYVFDSSSSKQ